MTVKYIAYCRVSTKKQNNGLQAQNNIIGNYIDGVNGKLVKTYSEKESGKNNNRAELKKAVEHCEKIGATLIVAKLDRLSREVSFIFELKQQLDNSKVSFYCVELPELNTLTLGIFATMAQHEREIISQRTKAGLQVAKAKGKTIGSPENLTKKAQKKGNKVHSENCKNKPANKRGAAYAKQLRENGLSFAKIAANMNEAGFTSANGKTLSAIQVKRMIDKY